MPWKQTCPMDEKIKFVAAVNTHQSSFAEVCREFGISRKSGYVLMRRYEQAGLRGLLARSRAPHTHPNAMDEAMAEQLLRSSSAIRGWGRARCSIVCACRGMSVNSCPRAAAWAICSSAMGWCADASRGRPGLRVAPR